MSNQGKRAGEAQGGAPCAFASGSTQNDAHTKRPPERCIKAILELFKGKIEGEIQKCEIKNAHDCPLRAYLPAIEDIRDRKDEILW